MARTLGLRKNPVKDEREQAFKQAALRLFSTRGYHKTTMQEIALEAGFGKGTLYWYWRSKEELYFALVQESHDHFVGLVRQAADMEGTAMEKLAWLGRETAELHYRERDYTKLSWKMRAEELETFSPEYVERMRANNAQTKRELQRIIEQGIEEGVLPPVDPYYLACMLLGLVEGMEIQWLEEPDSFDLREAMEMVLSLGARAQPFLKEMYVGDEAVRDGR
ncbi:MAG: TetR/AcrR family transcriptional regulator [Actinobacteria bacterium]|nr:TetR/AcrR family transcriptional regulator [Actinomycetota bacterium]MDI6831736.1 TetR/AcrR family transcriptional regulator [Actinomycetota bacterium]